MESRPASSVLKSSFPRESPMISPLMLFPFTSTTRSVVSRADGGPGRAEREQRDGRGGERGEAAAQARPPDRFPYFLPFSSSRRAPSTRECHP